MSIFSVKDRDKDIYLIITIKLHGDFFITPSPNVLRVRLHSTCVRIYLPTDNFWGGLKITMCITKVKNNIPAKVVFLTVAVVEVTDYQRINVLSNAVLQVHHH